MWLRPAAAFRSRLAMNEVIGAVWVSGAPGGENDEVCANAGIAKVAGSLQ
jgi:uncharacterized protein GlcG (DUF336 family)